MNIPTLRQNILAKKFLSGFTGKLFSVRSYRQPGYKWYMPRQYYPESRYTFLFGFTYILSMDKLDQLLKSLQEYSGYILDIDDLFITGVLANYAHIKRHNDDRFQFLPSSTSFHLSSCNDMIDTCLLENSLSLVSLNNNQQAIENSCYKNEALYRLWKQQQQQQGGDLLSGCYQRNTNFNVRRN